MSLRFHEPVYEAFVNAMRRFYTACQLNDQLADHLIETHEDMIKRHLNDTPELISRKIYMEVFNDYIN